MNAKNLKVAELRGILVREGYADIASDRSIRKSALVAYVGNLIDHRHEEANEINAKRDEMAAWYASHEATEAKADDEIVVEALTTTCKKCDSRAKFRIASTSKDVSIDVCAVHGDCLMNRIKKGEAKIVIAPEGYAWCASGCFRYIGNRGRAAHQCNAK